MQMDTNTLGCFFACEVSCFIFIFSVIFEGGDRTGIYLNTPGDPTVVDERDRWTETYVRWSPRGTYLATFHQKGIALWGGDKMKQIMRFMHVGVQLIDFSPCERYVVTFSPMPDDKDDPKVGGSKLCYLFHDDDFFLPFTDHLTESIVGVVVVWEVAAYVICFHVPRSCDSLFSSWLVIPVRALILSSQAVLGLPLPLFPSTEPCIINLSNDLLARTRFTCFLHTWWYILPFM